jgi:hypothetical protein
MRYANWALLIAFYAAGVFIAGALVVHSNTIDGALGGVMGAGAVLFVMLPSFVQWQDRCLSKADQRGRQALDTVVEAFTTEIREMDLRHQDALRQRAIDYGAAVARAELAEDHLARMNQGPKAWHQRPKAPGTPTP